MREPQAGHARDWSALLFVAPFFTVYLLAALYPLANGIFLSLHRADFFGGEQFIGFANFARLSRDAIFRVAVGNTFQFVAITVPCLVGIGLALALMLNRRTRSAAIFRAVFFSTSVLSVTIVTLLWKLMFIPEDGLVAKTLSEAGLEPVAFLSDPRLALHAVAIATIWWCLGLPMMLFLAALQQVPEELFEAAALDGTSRWRMFWRITFPSIRNSVLFVVMIEVVLQFQLFGQAQLMTQGGPNNASRPLVLFIYDVAFNRWDVGYASAASQILFAIILMAAFGHYLISRRRAAA